MGWSLEAGAEHGGEKTLDFPSKPVRLDPWEEWTWSLSFSRLQEKGVYGEEVTHELLWEWPDPEPVLWVRGDLRLGLSVAWGPEGAAHVGTA